MWHAWEVEKFMQRFWGKSRRKGTAWWPRYRFKDDIIDVLSGVRFPTGTRNFIILQKTSRPAVGPTQLTVQYFWNVFHPEVLKHINTTCQSITQHFIFYTLKIVYCQGDMFRPLLGHLQALWENGSKCYLLFQLIMGSQVLTDCVTGM